MKKHYCDVCETEVDAGAFRREGTFVLDCVNLRYDVSVKVENKAAEHSDICRKCARKTVAAILGFKLLGEDA